MDILDWLLIVFLILTFVIGILSFLYYAYHKDSKGGEK